MGVTLLDGCQRQFFSDEEIFQYAERNRTNSGVYHRTAVSRMWQIVMAFTIRLPPTKHKEWNGKTAARYETSLCRYCILNLTLQMLCTTAADEWVSQRPMLLAMLSPANDTTFYLKLPGWYICVEILKGTLGPYWTSTTLIIKKIVESARR